MKESEGSQRVRAIEVSDKSVSELLAQMGRTAFQGRTLAEAAEVWEDMIRRDDLVIAMGLSGSLSTAGQWKIICWLMEQGYIDLLVSTGANVSEDLVEAMGPGYWQGTWRVDDQTLLEADINRYYDTYGLEPDYRQMEDLLTDFLVTLRPGFRYTSAEVLHGLGLWLHRRGVGGIAASAAANNVPIFSPAMADSAFGEAFLMAANRGADLIVDQVREFSQFVGIAEKAKDIGVIYIGGGVPKDYTQLLAISLSPKTMDEKVAGRDAYRRKSLKEYAYPHRYAIQITTDSPQWGGLSGCTLDEAVSWGKIADQGRRVTCYCDATIALPLLSHALQERTGGKRRGPDLSHVFQDVRDHFHRI